MTDFDVGLQSEINFSQQVSLIRVFFSQNWLSKQERVQTDEVTKRANMHIPQKAENQSQYLAIPL